MMDNANCTVHFENFELRGELYRVLHPGDLWMVTVNFPYAKLLEHFPESFREITPDPNGEYRVRIPTVIIEPDEHVEYVPFYYLIGDHRDACPFQLGLFEWYKKEEIEDGI